MQQPRIGARAAATLTVDGLTFKDLNGNGVLDPYEDWRLPVAERVADLVTTIDSPSYRAIFDPANYVQCRVRPVDEAYPVVRPYTDYIHCKDASASVVVDGLNKVLPAGEGDGQFRELIAALQADGYDGFFSLEPHLGDFDAFGGLCGPELWTSAYDALTGLFREQGITWQ